MNKSINKIAKAVLLVLVAAFIFTGGTAGLWLIVGLMSLVALRLTAAIAIAAHRMIRSRRAGSPTRESVVKLVALLMGLFLITGMFIFMYTFRCIGEKDGYPFTNTEYIMRSFIYSVDMFMLDVDGDIFGSIRHLPALKALIVTQTVLSFACTMSLLLSLVFSRARAYIKLHRRTRITAGRNHLYIFFGVNEPSRLLARDACQNDPHSIIIFVDKANIDDDDSDSWSSIVNLFTHRRRTFAIADEAQALVAVTYKRLSDIDESDGDNIADCIGAPKIRQLIEQLPEHDDSQLHIFFLSDNEEDNIRGLATLARDKTVLATARTGVRDRIYCHARYNGPNRVVEDLAVSKGLDVTIVDSSHLAVEILKSDTSNQPVNVVRLSDSVPTAVASKLDCLIVGFGEVGRDAFRFLYEFGAFVDENSPEGHGDRSPFACTAIDSRMDALAGSFIAMTPALDFGAGKPLELMKLDYRHTDFYKKVLTPERAATINYIVLALGDDDDNIALAAELFNYIRCFREDLSDLIIMVRCTRDDKVEMMQKVADHHNFGYGRGRENTPVIRLFGRPKDVYSFTSIVNEKLLAQGKNFHDGYRVLSKSDETWEKRRKDNMPATGDAQSTPNLDLLRRLRRQETQDMANALHAGTKLHLLVATLGKDYRWDKFLGNYFDKSGACCMTGCFDKITYDGLTPTENEVIRRLAMLEHLRWNASHELLGYRRNDSGHRCDERRRLHNCLRQWHELDKESMAASSPDYTSDYKKFDFDVVNTTVNMAREQLMDLYHRHHTTKQ